VGDYQVVVARKSLPSAQKESTKKKRDKEFVGPPKKELVSGRRKRVRDLRERRKKKNNVSTDRSGVIKEAVLSQERKRKEGRTTAGRERGGGRERKVPGR